MTQPLRNLAARARLAVEELCYAVTRPDCSGVAAPPIQACRLEERVLLSASPAVAVVQAVADASAVAPVDAPSGIADAGTIFDANDAQSEYAANPMTVMASTESPADDDATADASSSAAQPGAELVVIDARVDDADDLLAELLNSDRDIRLLRLDPDSDGLRAITAKLERIGPVSAIHLLTHGRSGEIQLGSTVLNLSTLPRHAPELLAWQHSFTANADLLIYGCDAGSGADGQSFVSALAALTGADVAASIDRTGAAELSGDWELEISTGTIEATETTGLFATAKWSSTLDLEPTGEISVNVEVVDKQSTQSGSRGSRNAVAVDELGNSIVVWSSKNQDSDNFGVFGRLFNGDGTPRGSEFQINQETFKDQQDASVACDALGNFVVTWTSDVQDGSGNGVYYRRFNSAGTALSGELRANTTTAGDQALSSISMNRAGQFIIAWEGAGTGDGDGIFYRTFSADGSAVTLTERRANIVTSDTQSGAAVAMSLTGQAVVGWESANHLFLRRIDASGSVLGGEIQVDTPLATSTELALATDDSGNFTAVYRATASQPGIWARGFNADGTERFGAMQVASGDSTSASIAMTGSGGFVVTYEMSAGLDASDVYARRYDASGSAVTGEFQVNQYTLNKQQFASVAAVSMTDFVIAWSGDGSRDDHGVQMRQFANARPTITAIADVTINEDQSTSAINFTIDDPDGSVSALSVTASSDNLTLLPLSGILLGGTGAQRTIMLTPNPDQFGTAMVTVSVNDGQKTGTRTFQLVVNSVNDAPVLVTNTGHATLEGGWSTIDNTMLSVTDLDHTAAQLTYTLTTPPLNGTLRRSTTILTGGSTWTQDDINLGLLSYEHDGSETTSDAFQFTISDAAGGSLPATVFSLAISPQNDAPVLTPSAPTFASINGNETSAAVSIAAMLAAAVSDPDAGAVKGIAVFGVTGNGQWQHSQDGLTWTNIGAVSDSQALLLPDSDQLRYVAGPTREAATLLYRAWDRAGATSGLERTQFDTTAGVGSLHPFSAATDTATVSVITDAPVGQSDAATLAEDSTINLSVPAGWLHANWKWRQSIAIDNTTGTASLSDVPVLVTFTASSIDYGRTQDAGQDLRFVDSNGTLLAHEIEEWNEAGTSRVWVRLPSLLAGQSTSIHAYFGNASVADGQNRTAVWSAADTEAVVHLHGTPTDSSANAVGMTVTGATSAPGIAADAGLFDGVNDAIRLNSDAELNDIFAGGGTISAWINPTGWGENGFGRILDKGSIPVLANTLGNGWALQVTSAGGILFEHGFTVSTGRWDSAAGSIRLNEWTHVAVVYDSTPLAGPPQIFLNGIAVTTTETDAPLGLPGGDSSLQLTIGNRAVANDRTFEGRIDEVRVYSSARSAGQISADFRSSAGLIASISQPATPLGGVLANDLAPSGSPMTAVLVSGPSSAQAFALNADGSFSYTPVANFEGVDSFVYRAFDGTSYSTPVTVLLTITAVNDAPGGISLSSSSITGYTDAASIGIVNVVDVDDGDTHSVTVSDARFEIVADELRLRAGQQIDPIAESTVALTLTATDSGGLLTSRALTITVVNPNTPATMSLNNRVTSLNENTSTAAAIRVADVLIGDDIYGTNTVTLTGADAARFEFVAGQLFLRAGTILDHEMQASYTVTVQVDDATIGSTPDDQQTFVLSIDDLNEAPLASVGGPYRINEGDGLSVSAVASSDPDGDVLTFDWDIDGDGLFLEGSGQTSSFTWLQLVGMVPSINDNATRTIAVRVTDQLGLTSTATATLVIVNTPPTVTISGPAAIDSGATWTLSLATTDPGSDTITSWEINWGDGVIETLVGNPTSATHVFQTPGLTHTVTATVTDEDGTHPLTSGPVVVSVKNTPPSSLFLDSDRLGGNEPGAVVGNLSFVDPDSGDSHVWTISDGRFEVVSGQLKLKPSESIDPDVEPTVMLTIAVTDRAGESIAVSVTLRVNHPPTGVADSYQINTPSTFRVTSRAAGVLANDSDGDRDTLSAQLVSGPSHASSFTLNSNGTFSYLPNSGFAGSDSFTYRAFDGVSWSAPTTVGLYVNRPASLSFSRIVSGVDENTVLTFPLNIGTVVINDDTEGTNTLTLGGLDAAMFLLDGSNQLWLRAGLVLDHEALSQFSVTVSVDDPTIPGTPDSSQTLTLDVRDVNESPVSAALPAVTVLEDATAGIVQTATAFSDPDGDGLIWSIQIISQTPGLFSQLNINAATGEVSYDTADNAVGSAVIRVRGEDVGGLFATTLLTFTAQPVNDAPVAQNFSAFVTGTQSLAAAAPGVLAQAVDAEGSPMQAILLRAPTNGTLTFNANGSFVYQALENFFGLDSFQFAATDGALTSAAATVTIIVRPAAVLPPAQSASSNIPSTPTSTGAEDSSTGGVSSGGSSTTGDNSTPVVPGNPGTTDSAINGGSQLTDDDARNAPDGESSVSGPGAGPDAASHSFANSTELALTQSYANASAVRRRAIELKATEQSAASPNGVPDADARQLRLITERDLFFQQIVEANRTSVKDFEENLSRNVNFDARVVGSVGVVTTGFSVGYLLWIVRGGMLLSGLLAQMPAWTMVDPLLVVDDNQKDEDKESLQTLMEKQQAELNARKEDANSLERTADKREVSDE